MSSRIKFRPVKFTPEEMAIDAADVDASKAPVVARGEPEWQAFLSFRRGYVRLDRDLRGIFPDEAAVNRALRKLIEAIPSQLARKRKTA